MNRPRRVSAVGVDSPLREMPAHRWLRPARSASPRTRFRARVARYRTRRRRGATADTAASTWWRLRGATTRARRRRSARTRRRSARAAPAARRRSGRRRLGAQVVVGERRAGPLQRAVDRHHGGVEQLRDLVGLPLQDLAQDEHRALPRREVLQRGDERQSHRLALHRFLGRIAGRLHDPAVGDGSDPRARAAADRSARRPSRRA